MTGILKNLQNGLHHYANNNPILNIDINGDSTYSYNVATGAMTMTSEVGGNKSQIVNFVNEDGSAYELNGHSLTAQPSSFNFEIYFPNIRKQYKNKLFELIIKYLEL